jgi:endonuclease G
MNKKVLTTILTLVCIIGFWLFINFYTSDSYSEPNKTTPGTLIDELYYPSSTTGDNVQHANYSLSYDKKHKQAEWVLYRLTKKQLTYDDKK